MGRSTKKDQTVLLLGNYRPTLTLGRTFGRQGHDVIVTRGGGEGLSEYSRYICDVWNEPDPRESEEEFISALAELLQNHREIGVIIPVTECYAVAIARYENRLPLDRCYATPSAEIVLKTLDKPYMCEFVRNLGVEIAPFALVDNYSSLISAFDDLGPALVIRPLVSDTRILGKKALMVNSPAELVQYLPCWPPEHASLLIQRKVSGDRHNFFFAAQNGQIIRSVETKVLDTDHLDGTGLAVEGLTVETTPQIEQYTQRILSSLNYHGVGIAQYLVEQNDGQSSFSFLEINPRIAGSHVAPEAAGLELGPVGVQLAMGKTKTLQILKGRIGLHYYWAYGALRSIKSAVQNDEVGGWQAMSGLARIMRLSLITDVHMTWSWRDPLPTLALFIAQLFPVLAGRKKPASTGNKEWDDA